ncbi:hypothetical protein KP509_18G034700 [Ceratopteris richardii]|uniref:Flowering-promoting factor 1-like protein 1 n=1 Tax=Ceratopteris richardii TaxID=49495 RepID=A0A8T2ST70_CERRI|nr:hypothetical protein KP509_18G034700 [Ceratopteris richardii]
MAGVWHFGSDGVVRLVRDDDDKGTPSSACHHLVRREGTSSEVPKVLVYSSTNEKILSYADLQRKLSELGWQRLAPSKEMASTLQFQKRDYSRQLITLPTDFRCFGLRHMIDIVIKNQGCFVICNLA